jgi:RNA polymerase sigma factor (sigma-70 family)
MVRAARSAILEMIRKVAGDQRAGSLTDHEALERFRAQQDEGAFLALLHQHGPMVLGVCRCLLGNEADAEDAFQTTFLILAGKAKSIRKTQSLGSWLYGVAYRTALKLRAQQAGRKKHEAHDHPEPLSESADDLTWRETQQLIHEELNGLAARYREPLVLCYLQGRSQDEAAAELGLPKGTLKGRLERGRALMRARLLRRGLGPPAVLAMAAWPAAKASGCLPALLSLATAQAAVSIAAGQTVGGIVSARVVLLTQGVLRTMRVTKLKIVLGFLLALGVTVIGARLITHQVVADRQQESQATHAEPGKLNPAGPADKHAELADAEMHVNGVYGAKNGFGGKGGSVDVAVRRTGKPVVLVLTSYYPVDWRLTLADGARIKKVILSGYFAQEIQGLPADVPIVNRSYLPDDGSRHAKGWFHAYQWNSPQWREMVRRLNDMTGLRVASFQGEYQGESFVVDGTLGRDFGQKGLKPRASAS